MPHDAVDDRTQVSDVPPPPTIGPSSVLADRYVVLERLGEGGAGTVYGAFDRVLGAEVAVKCVGAVDGDALLRFKSEFRSVQELSHPNLIGLGELFEFGGEWFYSMERIDGTNFVRHARPLSSTEPLSTATTNPSAPSDSSSVGSVDDVSADRTIQSGTQSAETRTAPAHRNGMLDEGALRHILVQLCDAVEVLHRAGQVHRDLKPGNVLVTRSGRVVVLDFGLSIRLDRTSIGAVDSTIMGTPGYMAPEQAYGSVITPAADWYAVGVMLYECLTGRRPFVGRTETVLKAKRDLDPPAPRVLVPDVPADLDALAVSLLVRDPLARANAFAALHREQRTAPDVADPSSDEIFLGREVEIGRIEDAYRDVRRKRARRVVLSGPSGIGKSATVREAVRRLVVADASRPLYLHGRCYERERMAFNALDELVDVLTEVLRSEFSVEERAVIAPKDASLLAQAFPVLRRISPFDSLAPESIPDDAIERKLRLFAAVRELFTRLGRRRHVIIVLEDLQWADADSWSVLAECVRQPDAPPMFILGTARSELFDGTLTPAMVSVLTGGHVERIELASLGRDAAIDLATRLGSSSPEEAARLVDAADGHPLFLELLARRKGDSGEPSRAEHAPTVGTIGGMVRDALHEVASTQSAPSREVLACCAVAGRPISTSALRIAAHVDAGELHRSLRELRSARLVRMHAGHDHEAVETYHDQVRASVLEHLAPERLREHHERLVVALEFEGAEPEVLFRHCVGANQLERAREWAERAAVRADDALAFDQAATFYEAAGDGLADDAPRRVALDEKRADALANAGRGEAAARLYLRLSAHLQPDRVLPIKQRAAIELISAGVFEEGKAAMGEVMSALGLGFPTSSVGAVVRLLVARAPLAFTKLETLSASGRPLSAEDRMRLELCGTGATVFSVTDPFLGGYFASLYLRLAVKYGDAAHLAAALGNEATASTYMGKDEVARALFAQSLAIVRDVPDKRTSAFLDGCESAMQLIRQDDLRNVLTAAQRSIAGFRDVPKGSHMELRAIRLLEGNAYSIGGHYRGLDRVAQANVSSARTIGDQLSLASWLVEYAVSLRWLVADEPDGLEASIAEAMTLAPAASPFLRYQVALSSSWLDLYRGDFEQAVTALAPRMKALSSSLALKAPILSLLSAWSRARTGLAWAQTLPRASAAKVHKRVLVDIRELRGASQTLCRGWSESLSAALALQEGNAVAAEASLRKALALFEACRARGYAACARVQLGSLGAGDAGRSLRAEGLRYLVDQGVKDPERFVKVMLPGMPSRAA